MLSSRRPGRNRVIRPEVGGAGGASSGGSGKCHLVRADGLRARPLRSADGARPGAGGSGTGGPGRGGPPVGGAGGGDACAAAGGARPVGGRARRAAQYGEGCCGRPATAAADRDAGASSEAGGRRAGGDSAGTCSGGLLPAPAGRRGAQPCERLLHELLAELEHNTSAAVLQLDLRNASNLVSLVAAVAYSTREFPLLRSYLASVYLGADAPRVYGWALCGEAEHARPAAWVGRTWLRIEWGVQQGDPLGPLIHAAAMQLALLRIAEAHPTAIVRGFHDDVVVVAEQADLGGVLQTAAAAGAAIDAELTPAKCLGWSPAGAPALAGWPARWSTEGAIQFSVPLETDVFMAAAVADVAARQSFLVSAIADNPLPALQVLPHAPPRGGMVSAQGNRGGRSKCGKTVPARERTGISGVRVQRPRPAPVRTRYSSGRSPHAGCCCEHDACGEISTSCIGTSSKEPYLTGVAAAASTAAYSARCASVSSSVTARAAAAAMASTGTAKDAAGRARRASRYLPPADRGLLPLGLAWSVTSRASRLAAPVLARNLRSLGKVRPWVLKFRFRARTSQRTPLCMILSSSDSCRTEPKAR